MSLVATSVDTEALGNGGNIKISASEMSVNDRAVIRSALDADAEGQAGNIDIQVDTLSLDGNIQIVASTFGQGDAGSIFIQATDSVFLTDGATIFTNVGPGALGNGREININAKSLSLTEGAQLRTLIDPAFDNRPSGQGNAGSVNINVQDTVIFDGVSSFDGRSSGIQSSVSQGAVGNGGDINILAKLIRVTNSAELTASTSGEGIAGNISLIGTQSLNIFDEARVAAESNNGGTAGGLSFKTEELTIADAASASVSSPFGLAGNLNIKADSLSQNQGQITAETGVSEGDIGANINLEIADTWRIENESLVSATAFGDADGGNININQGVSDTDFLLFAFPPTGANGSDIIANADRGNGGRIDITAAGIFGIEFRDSQTPLNDFTVSSEFGSAGETIINRTVEDPTSGLIELPQAVGDASDQISQNPCQQGVGSEFIITGKGGFPANPHEALNNNGVQVDLAELASSEYTEEANTIPPENSTSEAVPAMGWVFNDKGQVTLTAYDLTNSGVRHSGQISNNSCSTP